MNTHLKMKDEKPRSIEDIIKSGYVRWCERNIFRNFTPDQHKRYGINMKIRDREREEKRHELEADRLDPRRAVARNWPLGCGR
jgi:hypothetical protein